MANIMDYLDWRGDLPLTVSPFNEVDGLILAELHQLRGHRAAAGAGARRAAA